MSTAAFTIITFPFLFSIMFGDLGHGIIVALFGAYLCFFEKSLKDKKFGEVQRASLSASGLSSVARNDTSRIHEQFDQV